MKNDQKGKELIGKIKRCVAGEFCGLDVLVLSVNEFVQTACVAIVIFGGTDAKPIEIDMSSLSQA